MANFEPLDTINLHTNDTILKSHHMPELVHLDDPAVSVMIDFTQTPAVTLKDTLSLESAHNDMEVHGTHFMLVTNEDNHIKGLLTAEDLLGEKPIKLMQMHRVLRDDIRVKALMTPLDKIHAINIDDVNMARVGNIVKTLHDLKSPYLMVVRLRKDGEKILRGCFTTSQISKQLHHNIRKRVHQASSVSELSHRSKDD